MPRYFFHLHSNDKVVWTRPGANFLIQIKPGKRHE
jgi:hypothetical protein